jgi:hypothetical protein
VERELKTNFDGSLTYLWNLLNRSPNNPNVPIQNIPTQNLTGQDYINIAKTVKDPLGVSRLLLSIYGSDVDSVKRELEIYKIYREQGDRRFKNGPFSWLYRHICVPLRGNPADRILDIYDQYPLISTPQPQTPTTPQPALTPQAQTLTPTQQAQTSTDQQNQKEKGRLSRLYDWLDGFRKKIASTNLVDKFTWRDQK